MQVLSSIIPQRFAKKRSRMASAFTSGGKKNKKKTQMFQYVFIGVMCIIVCVSATGVGVYWFFNALFSILQSYIVHRVIMNSRRKNNALEARLEKLGIR
jgi:YidC/Oxa1 family membrane protein insertase